MALHWKHLVYRTIQPGRKRWCAETRITLLGPNILKVGLVKPGGQPRGGQEIPAGDEAEQRDRLTRLEIVLFSQEMALKDNHLSAGIVQCSRNFAGARTLCCHLHKWLLAVRSKALFLAFVLLARVRISIFYISTQ